MVINSAACTCWPSGRRSAPTKLSQHKLLKAVPSTKRPSKTLTVSNLQLQSELLSHIIANEMNE